MDELDHFLLFLILFVLCGIGLAFGYAIKLLEDYIDWNMEEAERYHQLPKR